MKIKAQLLAVVIIAGAFALSCDFGTGGDGKQQLATGTPSGGGVDSSGVDWTDYSARDDYAILINNHSNKDLVVFKNDVKKENIAGGVAANKDSHGIKANTALFGTTHSFTLIFITKEDFEAYKDNSAALQALKQAPFTRIFAFYNKSGSNDTPFEVSNKLGGNNTLSINNGTAYDMELRIDAARGTPLGYAPYESMNTRLSMISGDYYLFPVFTKYNPVRDELIRMYPRQTNGKPINISIPFSSGNQTKQITASDYLGIGASLSTGAAYLVVENQSNNGIRIGTAQTELQTETGNKIIGTGERKTFTILFDKADGSYETFQNFSGYRIIQGLDDSVAIPTISTDEGKMEVDYRYYVTVTGNWYTGDQAVTIQKSGSKLTLSDLTDGNEE
jgi:hypothetical protein